ncbi:MAG: hypothetical protein ACJAVV_000693 [Alphaproteobacteria bacterium]|jgi:hypothetical protein
MKKILLIIAVLGFASNAAAEESWWNTVLSAVGLGEETTVQAEGPNLDGMLNSVTSNLGVTSEQAQGGMAALINYAKQNVSEEQFAMLAEKVPGLDSVMQYLPIVKEASSSGLGGLMEKAASYNESLGQLNQLNKQFESLGLDTGMIKGYAEQATQYLDTPEGQDAKKLLTDSLFKI